MKFRSTTGQDVHIGLTSGHSCVVTSTPTEIPAIFHREAIARGCTPDGVSDEVAPVNTGFDREQTIIDALNGMLDGGDEKDFNTNGKPDLRALNAKVGFTVARDEADRIWDALSKA